jgi:N utilization substance protein B
VPYRVVINEAVELAKVFGAEMGHKYVNGVLDRVAKEARAIEVKAKQKR